jgi:hypothetical protein
MSKKLISKVLLNHLITHTLTLMKLRKSVLKYECASMKCSFVQVCSSITFSTRRFRGYRRLCLVSSFEEESNYSEQ